MKRPMSRFVISLGIAFLYLPVMVLILFSFNDSKSALTWTGFSLRWYGELFRDKTIMDALKNTLAIALASSFLSVTAGLISCWGLTHMDKRLRRFVLKINDIPLVNPDLVTGISLMILFLFFRFKFGYTTLLLAHMSFCIPYVVITVLPQMRSLTSSQLEAAMDLGASPFKALTAIILPQLFPSILTSWLICFTLSIDDFVISFFTTGSGVNNISIVVYSMARRGVNPKINALSTLLLGSIFILLMLINSRKKNKKEIGDIEQNLFIHGTDNSGMAT